MNTHLGFPVLANQVIERGSCIACGACVIACPYRGVLDSVNGTPKLVGECTACGLCSQICPRNDLQPVELEKQVCSPIKNREDKIGIVRAMYVAKSTNDEVLKRCQDGGVVTTLIIAALEAGSIDGAIISGLDPSVPWFPQPFMATCPQDVLRYAGTRYTYSPNLLALKECRNAGLKRIAFVGTPCQVLALRRIQQIPLKHLSDIVVLTIGLFCSESFTYDGLMIKKIRDEMGINLYDIQKITIKSTMLIMLKDGKKRELSLQEAKKYADQKCRSCTDFSAELADISLGGVGLEGRTFSIIRTKQGEQFFNHAIEEKRLEIQPFTSFARSYHLLVQLSQRKHKNAQPIV